MLRRSGLLLVGLLVTTSVLVLIIWTIPAWLTRGSGLTAVERYRAMADVRTGLTAALVALGAAGGLAYTASTFRLSQVGQLTGRFASASKQMGDNDQTVRLAGIHAMAQLADEWAQQRQTCVDVLCAFLRVTSAPGRPQSDDLREARRTALRIIRAHLRPGHRHANWQRCEFDLTGAVLNDADFTEATFDGARILFEDVRFEGDVRFDGATFAGGRVSFRGAKLTPGCRVSFINASFRGGRVIFDDVTFGGGETRFDRAVFTPRCLVTFERARLGDGGSVYFEGTTVRGPGLSFANAYFSSGEGEVRFDRATFIGTVHFDSAEFDDDVHFDGARLVGADLVFTAAKWKSGRISFEGADCEDLTMNFEQSVPRMGSIDLRGRANGTPRIIGTDPDPPFMMLTQ